MSSILLAILVSLIIIATSYLACLSYSIKPIYLQIIMFYSIIAIGMSLVSFSLSLLY